MASISPIDIIREWERSGAIQFRSKDSNTEWGTLRKARGEEPIWNFEAFEFRALPEYTGPFGHVSFGLQSGVYFVPHPDGDFVQRERYLKDMEERHG